MANDLNKVFLIGRLTRDPEYKSIGENAVVNFAIANNRSYLVNREKRDEVYYFECEAWGKLAEILRQYAKKGKQVMVEGRLKYESWEGADGKKNSRIRITAENVQLLGSSLSSESGPEPGEAPSRNSPDFDVTQPPAAVTRLEKDDTDDIPF